MERRRNANCVHELERDVLAQERWIHELGREARLADRSRLARVGVHVGELVALVELEAVGLLLEVRGGVAPEVDRDVVVEVSVVVDRATRADRHVGVGPARRRC